MKIKKEEKAQLQKLPSLSIRYNLAVPLMGVVDVLTMGSFYQNPATDGMAAAKVFFVVCGLMGVLFTIWALLWNVKADGKNISVFTVFKKRRVIPLSDLQKVRIKKKEKSGSLVYFELVDRKGEGIVRLYPLMKDSSLLLERLKRLKYPMEEI